jgi:hypothetical protein
MTTHAETPSPITPAEAWLKLADYGDHPHAGGLQRLSLAAAQSLVRQHKSLYGRLRRYFGGVPVYIGHPDDPNFRQLPTHADSRAYAWIHDLEARADGLYIRPIWSAKGRELLDNAHYKHLSPRWKMRPISPGIYEPIELVSVGLTNQPNIPGPTIANELSPQAQAALLAPLAAALGLPSGADIEAIAEAIKAMNNATAAAADRLALINAQLELALERGQIALGEKELWRSRLSDPHSGTTAANELLALPRGAMRVHAPLLSDSAESYSGTSQRLRADFIRTVEARMRETGEDFASAWNAIKERRREIFSNL